ncbi:DUF3499 domain-containing protein [Glycomyces paridis]|uniref:DUF3499 domain-containing protein n=1 Tax=Glycomyces paridis TaxID=2126555 RepID=A0A4S8PMG1_9ACTN|nr:DUF3499 domain-containing protein [Glycomyces paridis]THV32063.1 DUF3499 domain-containing protein [Glycomyces paridis]
MRSDRRCSRNGCRQPAVATLTYIYSDSTAVVGPLSTAREPHSYDLCDAHARRLTVPHGWELVRHQGDYAVPMPTDDDLVALANAVREAAVGDRPDANQGTLTGLGVDDAADAAARASRRLAEAEPAPHQGHRPAGPQFGARRHLRVVSGDEDPQR